ncbi:MAG TPA: hypothetical protein VFE39_04675 [Pseudonocardia sp.]|nr:hypothetical protein [Pseudonocardia sp.]
MTTPYTLAEQRAARARVDSGALAETADLLRQVARHDGHVDARRGDVSASLAALVEAIGRGYREVPHEVAAVAMSVVAAVDRATGHRRS